MQVRGVTTGQELEVSLLLRSESASPRGFEVVVRARQWHFMSVLAVLRCAKAFHVLPSFHPVTEVWPGTCSTSRA